MDTFIEQIEVILPILGLDLFRRRVAAGAAANPATGPEVIFTFSTAGASARARETDDGFVVLTGSTARRQHTGTFPRGYLALRQRLLAEGRLMEGPSPELYRFADDAIFSSPSAAASIVAGRSAGGPLEWKLEGTGQSYRDWRAAKLEG